MSDRWEAKYSSCFLLSGAFSWKSEEKWIKKHLLDQFFITYSLEFISLFEYLLSFHTFLPELPAPASICDRPLKWTLAPWITARALFGIGVVRLSFCGIIAKIIKIGIFIKVLVFCFNLRELPALFDHQKQNCIAWSQSADFIDCDFWFEFNKFFSMGWKTKVDFGGAVYFC